MIAISFERGFNSCMRLLFFQDEGGEIANYKTCIKNVIVALSRNAPIEGFPLKIKAVNLERGSSVPRCYYYYWDYIRQHNMRQCKHQSRNYKLLVYYKGT